MINDIEPNVCSVEIDLITSNCSSVSLIELSFAALNWTARLDDRPTDFVWSPSNDQQFVGSRAEETFMNIELRDEVMKIQVN